LSPDEWRDAGQTSPSVYYKSPSAVMGQFQFYNMPARIFFDDEKVFASFNERRLSRRVRDIYSRSRAPEYAESPVGASLRKQSTRLRDKYTQDLHRHGEQYAIFKYGSSSFSGLVCRRQSALAPKVPTVSLPDFGEVVQTEVTEYAKSDAA